MPSISERDFRRSLKEKSFDPAYYVFGDEELLKDDAVKALVDGAVDPATRDFNLDVRRGAELDAEGLLSLVGTPPMMAERRAVVVRDVGALKKDVRGALERYLARPAPETVLVLVAPAGAKPDRVLQERATSIEFEALRGDRVPKWIAHFARTELGVSITPAAAELLQGAVGNDLPRLASELDKLASYAGGGEIDEHAVQDVVGVRRGETLGDFLDRVLQRDAAGALGLVDHILSQPKTTAVQVVMALATQTLAVAWGQARFARGTPRNALAREYFDLLKAGGAFPGRPWGEAATAWTNAVERWTPDQLDRALAALLAADCALKESRVSSEEQVLATAVLELCA
ncbi:MAG: DNA polymerase III subunit delta [Gemmatimonadaceae bacterium]